MRTMIHGEYSLRVLNGYIQLLQRGEVIAIWTDVSAAGLFKYVPFITNRSCQYFSRGDQRLILSRRQTPG